MGTGARRSGLYICVTLLRACRPLRWCDAQQGASSQREPGKEGQRPMSIVITREQPDTPDAIALYERLGFAWIGPFGAYTDDPLGLFYAKQIPGRAVAADAQPGAC